LSNGRNRYTGITPARTLVLTLAVLASCMPLCSEDFVIAWPHSLIPGGIATPDQYEAQRPRGADVGFLRPQYLQKDVVAWVDYRDGDSVRWTAAPVKLHKGELVFTDRYGHMVRGRCGNDISLTAPPKSYLPSRPVDLETPQVSMLPDLVLQRDRAHEAAFDLTPRRPAGQPGSFLPSTTESPSTVLPPLALSAGGLLGGASLGGLRGPSAGGPTPGVPPDNNSSGGGQRTSGIGWHGPFTVGLPPGAVPNRNPGGGPHGGVAVDGTPPGPDFPLGDWPGGNPYGNGGFPGGIGPGPPGGNLPNPPGSLFGGGPDGGPGNGDKPPPIIEPEIPNVVEPVTPETHPATPEPATFWLGATGAVLLGLWSGSVRRRS
jgi:hypothetical protein